MSSLGLLSDTVQGSSEGDTVVGRRVSKVKKGAERVGQPCCSLSAGQCALLLSLFVSKLCLCLLWCGPRAYEIELPLAVSDCSHASAPDIQVLELSKASCNCNAVLLRLGGAGDRLQSIIASVVDATFSATHFWYRLLHVVYEGLWSWDTICSVHCRGDLPGCVQKPSAL